MSEEPKKKVGRPRAVVNEDQLKQLASIGCTMQEMAAVMNCSTDTLERNFAGIIAKGQDEGKTRLRKAQLQLALKGNAVMLIWLGKQILGQSDKIEQKTEHSGNIRHGNILPPEQAETMKQWIADIQSEVKMRNVTKPEAE